MSSPLAKVDSGLILHLQLYRFFTIVAGLFLFGLTAVKTARGIDALTCMAALVGKPPPPPPVVAEKRVTDLERSLRTLFTGYSTVFVLIRTLYLFQPLTPALVRT